MLGDIFATGILVHDGTVATPDFWSYYTSRHFLPQPVLNYI